MHMLIGIMFVLVFGITSWVLCWGTVRMHRLILRTKAIKDTMVQQDKMLLRSTGSAVQRMQWKC